MELTLSVFVRVLQRSGTRIRSILESFTHPGETPEYENEYEYDLKQVAHYVKVIMELST